MGLSAETNNEKEKMDVVKLLHSEYSQFKVNTIYLLSNPLYYIDYITKTDIPNINLEK